MNVHLRLLCFFAFFCFFIKTSAQSPQLELEYFAYGLERPVDIAHPAGDTRLYVVQQTGKIRIVDPASNTILPEPFLDLTGTAVMPDGNEQGFLGLAFHPDYANNGYFFVNYINIERKTIIARYKRSANNPDKADANSGELVLSIPQPFGNHNGGCLRFGKDGYLYIATGDGGFSDLPADPYNNAQNPGVLLGKMLRIDVHTLPYTIPPDNPFIGNGNFAPEIWAYGLRNPWRFNFDSATGDLWIGDVGMMTVDEVDFHQFGTPAGHNYGWKCLEGTHPYANCPIDTLIFTPPVFEYANVGGFCGASVVGGVVYHGAQYPGMQGWYIFNDFCTGNFYGLKPDGNGGFTNAFLGHFTLSYDYSAFGEGEDGEIYMTGYISQGLYRIKDKCKNQPAPFPNVLFVGDSTLFCPNAEAGLTYQWELNGAPISGGDQMAYKPTASGNYTVLLSNSIGCQAQSEPFSVLLLSIPDVDENEDFRLLPNPTTRVANLFLGENTDGAAKVEIFDETGKAIESLDFQYIKGQNLGRVLVFEKLGIYFVKLTLNGKASVKKLVVSSKQ